MASRAAKKRDNDRSLVRHVGLAMAGMLLADRLYLGYQEKAATIEVISYNETAARFEYQVVRDYREGGAAEVYYADRATCIACATSMTAPASRGWRRNICALSLSWASVSFWLASRRTLAWNIASRSFSSESPSCASSRARVVRRLSSTCGLTSLKESRGSSR